MAIRYVNSNGNLIRVDGKDFNNVISANSVSDFPETGQKNVIYVDKANNELYVWDETSSQYEKASSSGGGGAVNSVNSKTGDVVLDATDIKITTTNTTIQQNIVRIDEEINRVESDLTEDIDGEINRAEQAESDLNDRIDNLSSFGRELSGWNCATGLPVTEPPTDLHYEYRTGDYYIVENVGTTNYKPSGTEYDGTASTTLETDTDIKPLDVYRFDGSAWYLIKRPQIDLTNYYTKSETYNQTEVDNLMLDLAGELGDLLEGKADIDDDNYVEANGVKDTSGNIITPSGLSGFITINAPTRATLTQAEYDIFTSGKVVNLVGNITLGGITYSNIKILNANNYGSGVFVGTCLTTRNANNTQLRSYYILANKTFGLYGNDDKRLDVFSLNSVNGKEFPSYSQGQFVYDGTNLRWIDNGIVSNTATTYSGTLTSAKQYNFPNALTSLTIQALEIQTGDINPSWKIKFIVGSGFSFSSTPTLNWKNGTPNFNDFVGDSVEIAFEKSLETNKYDAWLI